MKTSTIIYLCLIGIFICSVMLYDAVTLDVSYWLDSLRFPIEIIFETQQ